MLNLSILIVIIGLIYWLLRLRRRGFFKKPPKVSKVVNKISGQEVQVFLDYNTPIEHLAFDGVRFGQQFRYKSLEEIGLPNKCNFRIKPIQYSSDTLFQEELSNETHDHNVFGTISLEEAKLTYEKELKEAKKEAANIVEKANSRSSQILNDAKVKAEAEAEKIIESGSKKLENEANKTREELKQQLSSIVVETASKIIDEEIDEKKHENIIKKAAEEI